MTWVLSGSAFAVWGMCERRQQGGLQDMGRGEGWEEGRREGEGERRLIGLEKETEIKLGLEREEVSCTGRRGRRNK